MRHTILVRSAIGILCCVLHLALVPPSHAGMTPPTRGGLRAPDGSGGMFHAWVDYRDGNGDIYLTRISSSGAVATGWPYDGVPVCTSPGEQGDFEIYPDGSGGVIVIWLDGRDDLVHRDTYAQRVDPLGVAQWTANGIKVLPSSWPIENPQFTPDGTGGLVIVWTGTGGPAWDVNTTPDWSDNGSLITNEKFFNLDNVSFGNGAAVRNVTQPALPMP